VLTADLNWGNAMQAGPDGHLYYPHMLSQQVWRISPDGGTPELVANDVDAPVAVRFDRDGVLYVLSLRPDGLITRIDLTSGDRSTFVTGIAGLDNAAFDDDNRMYVSSFARSGVTEMRPDGGTRPVVRQGLVGPFGITVGGDGTVYAADHFSLAAVGTDGTDPRTVDLVSGGLPAFVHGVASGGDILHLTTTAGEVHGYDTAARKSWARATGLGELTGIAAGPDGDVVVAATGTGRVLRLAADDTVTVLADGLDHPVGVAVAGDGACYVSDDHRGRITNLTTGQTVAEDLGAPQGIAIIGDTLYAIDVRDRRLLAITDGKAVVVAENLPVIHRTEPTTAVAVGRPSQFADLTVTPDGSLLMSANGEGSLLRLS
jgi:sugar lactone lactonase YvrE